MHLHLTEAQMRAALAHLPEIRFFSQPNGTTLVCYQINDGKTFNLPIARESRGVVFDRQGTVCSRPLHKFFNVGEQAGLDKASLLKRTDLHCVFEKLDGSMIATAWVQNKLYWRSKQSFSSDVVKLARRLLLLSENTSIQAFAEAIASRGLTAIFELTHPLARIVVPQNEARLRLLHVRDNATGEYVLLDEKHFVHELIRKHSVPMGPRYQGWTVKQAFDALEGMQDQEGFVLQFADGDMVKLKCDWYQKLHGAVTFLRERDIATSTLAGNVDDLKALLSSAGFDLAPVLDIETRVKDRLLQLTQETQALADEGSNLDAKDFALKYKGHPLFGLAISLRKGQEPDWPEFFTKRYLKKEFTLRVLADGALTEMLAEG